MLKVVFMFSLFVAFFSWSSSLFAYELDVSSKSVSLEESQNADAARIRNRVMQSWGKVLLGAGMLSTMVGAIFVEVDSFGSLGLGGFLGAANGVSLMIVSMFILGFSRAVHEVTPPPTRWKVIAGEGVAAVSYSVVF